MTQSLENMALENTALKTYRDAFERLAPDLPQALRAAQHQQLERFLQLGFPTKRQETWRYTDLSALADASFTTVSNDGAVPELPRLAKTTRMVFVNGRHRADLSDSEIDHGTQAPEQTDTDAIVALNAALSADGLNLHLDRGQKLPQILHLISFRQADSEAGMSHLRHRIVLGDNAEAEVILHQLGDGDYFGTEVLEVVLAPGARLKLHRLQEESSTSTQVLRIDAQLARGSVLQASSLDLGGGLIRQDFNVALEGEGAEVTLNALCAANGRAHVDNHTRIEHRAPHCRSRELFRGIVAGRAHAVFDGLIVVAPGAVKTDSEQQVASLLLSPKAEINAKPELEIYNDDVKCSHGATVGQLDETALFYLRSRGLDLLSAKSLLTRAFAHRALEGINFAPLREFVEQRLDARLRALLTEAGQ